MRVVHLIDSLAAHGAERSLVELAPHLLQRGIDLEVALLRDPATLVAELESMEVPVHDLRGPDRRAAHRERVADMLSDRRPDLVHTTLYSADVAGRPAAARLGIPAVTTWAVTAPVGGTVTLRAKRLGALAIDRRTAATAARFHAVSEPVAQAVGRRMGVDRSRIDVIPRGRDPERLCAGARERAYDQRRRLGVDGPLIVALARHDFAKGLDRLVEATPDVRRVVPDVVVVLAGDEGAETARLTGRIAELDLTDTVKIIGPTSDVGGLLAAADVCAVPSRVEGFPGTVVEAMLAGTPLVASDIDSIRAAIPDSTMASLVSPITAENLARGLIDALLHADNARARAARARAHASDNYTLEPIAASTRRFYERALDRELAAA